MRRGGTEFTKAMRERYEVLRRREHRALADRVLAIVGVREHAGRLHVSAADVEAHESELLQLSGHLKAWYTASERHALYNNNLHLGAAIMKLVLGAAGYTVDATQVDVDGEMHRGYSVTDHAALPQ
jgi:hypothetical protein